METNWRVPTVFRRWSSFSVWPRKSTPSWPTNISAGTRSCCRLWPREGIRILSVAHLDRAGKDAMDLFFTRRVDPILTPVTIDPSHPFPHVINKALCVAFQLRRHSKPAHNLPGRGDSAAKNCPPGAGPEQRDGIDYIFLHDLIETHTRNLYKGYHVISSGAFRATRNSNLYLHEEESRNLLDLVDTQLHSRRKGDVVRLEIEADAAAEIVDPLAQQFGLQPWQVFKTQGPVNLSRLFFLADQTPRPDLKFQPFTSKTLTFAPKVSNLFEEITQAGHSAASSLRFVRTGGFVYRVGGTRSASAFHQADALPDERKLSHRACSD